MIRHATASDAAAICEIWNDAIRKTTATFTTQEKERDDIIGLVENSPVFVLQDEDAKIAGFATYGPFRSGPGYVDVAEHSIYLSAQSRRSGHGRKLLSHTVKHAFENGIRILIAGIGGENTNAEEFHAAMGFDKVGHMPAIGSKFGRHHDLIFMQKNLAAPD
ncbi:MAG: N-acetyltransferase family protein [Aliishimia sp.]